MANRKKGCILLMALALAGCGGDPRSSEVTLAVLAGNAEAHDGSRVVTEGVVRHFEEPLHYWIEDEDLNRVELFPHDAIAPYLGERVRVEGQFAFSREEGRRLTLDSVETLDAGD
ncbi:hypothetical protein [Halomonas sp. RA08-2]|uniref:hypothetical protein n=1 Tax=Halomonas sp. RA08-2 TaxID=3440842 RepID=UPI003EE98619